MEPGDDRILTGRVLSVLIVIGAVVSGLMVLYHSNHYPRTDDSEILANFIGIAPQVEGPVITLNVHDNQFVKKGDLLFEIDPRPYRYALERAISEQATLEGQISDERRRIAALVSAVSVAEQNIHSMEADVHRWVAAVDQARADVANADEAVGRARAEWGYASNNLHRVEPLLLKQFVTVDQVDRARTTEVAQAQTLRQAESQLRKAQAALEATIAQEQRSRATLSQSRLRADLGLIIVAIKKRHGAMLYTPAPETVLEAGDTLIALGKRSQLDQLEQLARGRS